MIRGQDIPNDRLYEPTHIQTVQADMAEGFLDFFAQFAPDKLTLLHHMQEGLEKFLHERPQYLTLLDRDYLEEFESDPHAFKSTLKKDCPIIRRCLNSPAKVMDAYRSSFYQSKGDRMLQVAINLSEFATGVMPGFDALGQLGADHPATLGVSDLDTEPYTAFGVIGGGIRSHFLYNLYPVAFPNRSQNSVWVYYFLTHQKDYGFEDGSEFLMINSDGSGTQQNFFYPYDLFTFYATRLYLLLRENCKKVGYELDETYRYVYLNTFLDFVAGLHSEDINALKPFHEQFDY
jgi:hypothetical protein